jgi:uncharacterized protein YeaO (DUF488 family)
MGLIKTKRIYLLPAKTDGFRILVDRLWPRGISKQSAELDLWLKEIAPSTELRKWYHSDNRAGRWEEFKTRYLAELKNNAALAQLLEIITNNKAVTLLFSVSDEEHNHAIILKDFITEKI